jgi:hypothetical protein
VTGNDEDGDNGSDLWMNGDPVQAFGTLGHELRLAIVETLAARSRASPWGPDPMGFEELRSAVGTEDSGRFNYHLNELVGSYVERIKEGYVLAPAGYEVSLAILRGSHAEMELDPIEGTLSQTCPECDGKLQAQYENNLLSIRCPDDGYLFGNTVPPGAATIRGVDEIAALAERDVRRKIETAVDGVCPECMAEIDMTVPADVSAPASEIFYDPDSVYSRFECQRCGLNLVGGATDIVLDHPAVVSFYHDHDRDIRDCSYVEFENTPETVVSRNPPRTRIEFTVDENGLALTIDGEGNVIATERDGSPE